MTKFSFEQTLIEVWRQALVENAKAVKVVEDSQAWIAASGLRISTGTRFEGWMQNPEYEIPLGAVGAIWQKRSCSF